MLWHLGLCRPWRDCPSQGWPVPADSKHPPKSMLFKCKSASAECLPSTSSLIGSQKPGASLSPCPNHLRAGTRQLETAPIPQCHRDCSNQPILNLFTPPCLTFAAQTTSKALAHVSPMFCLLSDSSASLWARAWCGVSLSLGLWVTNCLSVAVVSRAVGLTIPK